MLLVRQRAPLHDPQEFERIRWRIDLGPGTRLYVFGPNPQLLRGAVQKFDQRLTVRRVANALFGHA